jgi:hypothetical protein
MSQSQVVLRSAPSEKKKKSDFSVGFSEDDDGGQRGRGFEGEREGERAREREGEREGEMEAEVKAEVERERERRERERGERERERKRERERRERGKAEIDEAIGRRKEEVAAYHHKMRERVAAIQGIYSLSSNERESVVGNVTAEFAGRFSEFVPAVDTEEEDRRLLMQTEYRGSILRAKHKQHPARTRPLPTADKRSKASKSADKSADKSANLQKYAFSESRRHRDKEAEREKEKDLAHADKLRSRGFATATRTLPVSLGGLKTNEVNFKTLRAACGQLFGGRGTGRGEHDAHMLPKSKRREGGKGGDGSLGGRGEAAWVEYAELFMVLAQGEVLWYVNEAEYEARVWPQETFPVRFVCLYV